MNYTELQVTSNFTFLRGGAHPEELIATAKELGYTQIAITDRNSLAGAVRAHVAAKKLGLKLIIGCRLDLMDGHSLLAYPTSRKAYGLLSTLISKGNLRTEKGKCCLYKEDVYEHREGMIFIIVPPDDLNTSFNYNEGFINDVADYKKRLGNDIYIAAKLTYAGDDHKKLYNIGVLAKRFKVNMVAVNDVHYHNGTRRELQDVLTCVREKCTIHNAGYKLLHNAERYLKPAEEMERLFTEYPQAIKNTQVIARACNFNLDELKYIYPTELTDEGRSPQEQLEMLVWQGARKKFTYEKLETLKETIEHELQFINSKQYASYFLTVHDFVDFARRRDILCQGRGSAANSVVCYCLGITSVSPDKFKLLFARFMSDARNEPPDIDVDFEHERREEVMQYIYNKYGRDRAAVVATVTQLHFKGAIRDVGKAMGLTGDVITTLTANMTRRDSYDDIKKHMPVQHDAYTNKVLQLTGDLIGFPRQLGQHTGGFIITENKLAELCPLLNARMDNRVNIEWNKDDIEALGFLKVDVLALGMLTCIRKAFDLAKLHYNLNLNLHNIPEDDVKVYEMISAADTIGVFQVESRAQMSMLPRLRPRCFYDLVIQVAIVRPGPIQGDMVHPYLRRRNGEERVEYPSKNLEYILERTLGIPLFQEQAMEIAIKGAGFTPAEADELRRSMASFKSKGLIEYFKNKLVNGMVANGYTEDFANRIFKQLKGFSNYGFPESHAASFALLVYISAWLKCHYPDVFATALLNSLPMGFYSAAQIIKDARGHNVQVLPIDINHSAWDNVLEVVGGKYKAIRLGLRNIKGLGEKDVPPLADEKGHYKSMQQVKRLIAGTAVKLLANADAFTSIGLSRREALWQANMPEEDDDTLFKTTGREGYQTELPIMGMGEGVMRDLSATGFSVKAHPLNFIREQLNLLGVTPAGQVLNGVDGEQINTAGLITVRQRPGTAKGVLFITIEDETGFTNLIVWKAAFEKYRKEILQARLLMVSGRLQVANGVQHVVVTRCYNLNHLLASVTESKVLSNEISYNIFDKGRNFR